MSSVMDSAVDRALEIAQKRGLQMDVLAFERQSTSISFEKRSLEKFQVSETRQLGVRVIDGQNEGVAYTEALDAESLASVVSEAHANSKMIRKESISHLAESTKLNEIKGIYAAENETEAVEKKIEAARTMETAALDVDPRVMVKRSNFSDMINKNWIANTRGLRASYKTSYVSGWTMCLCQDGDAPVAAWEASLARKFSAFDAAKTARSAAELALSRIGAIRPRTGTYTVVFDERVSEDLIEMISGYFSAKAVDDQTSPLAGKLGQKIFSSQLSLLDDPFFAAATGSRPIDAEGYSAQATPLIENGVLKHFLTNSVLAEKLRLKHTASASRAPSTDLDISPSNILVRPGKAKTAELLNAEKNVVLITQINGQAGFREASGDFSLPVEGFLYENGKRSVALKDFLISGNILELFAGVEAVGESVRAPVGNIVCPPLLVRGLNISGQA